MTLKQIVEALLLASPEPLDDKQLQALLADEGATRVDLAEVLGRLQAECQDRPLELVRVASGWRYQVRRDYAPWVQRLFPQKAGRYSRAMLETLAIIAYRQPVSRGDIEAIRGVAVSSQIIRTLEAREWIRIVGHKEVPGRPALYATTRRFLDDFNLQRLEQLPPLPVEDDDETETEPPAGT
ncbi:segregation and condensation protein B [Methylomarinovum caldicuralii]|uniref:Segregation and condensation protein B n=1 Tax=Methylomarinovum caldicuralii TaxID=438856 RepID=A0AAU9BVJ9_9GAMM|nr:SMC-Scp complex subunit ScpB [Methylomarinovum caldicuralii]BCX83013.1 segregation and condensation protein B [Methylomarinovum caldicuralii]